MFVWLIVLQLRTDTGCKIKMVNDYRVPSYQDLENCLPLIRSYMDRLDEGEEKQLANSLRALMLEAFATTGRGYWMSTFFNADVMAVLHRDFIRTSPLNPGWVNRDRWVLSNGHAGLLQYAALALLGYDSVSIEDIRCYRQHQSKLETHPMSSIAGVDISTGLLGQGMANAVGMAMSRRHWRKHFNQSVLDFNTYVFFGEGCTQEGVFYEAINLASVYELGSLVAFFDANGCLGNKLDDWMSEARVIDWFKQSGWHVQSCKRWHVNELKTSIRRALNNKKQPSLIVLESVTDFVLPNRLKFDPRDSKWKHWINQLNQILINHQQVKWSHRDWMQTWTVVRRKNEESYKEWCQGLSPSTRSGQILLASSPQAFHRSVDDWFVDQVKHYSCFSQDVTMDVSDLLSGLLEGLSKYLPQLLVGSSGMMDNLFNGLQSKLGFENQHTLSVLEFGTREFAMAAMMNGMAISGGVLPVMGTLSVFYEYSISSLRVAAEMHAQVIGVGVIDSMGGTHGYTHQMTCQTTWYNNIRGLLVLRPVCIDSFLATWYWALKHRGPSLILMERSPLARKQSITSVTTEYKGMFAYDVVANAGPADVTLFCSGQKAMAVAIASAEQLKKNYNLDVRVTVVISMAYWRKYRKSDWRDQLGLTVVIDEAGLGCWLDVILDESEVIDAYTLNNEGERVLSQSLPSASLWLTRQIFDKKKIKTQLNNAYVK